MTEKKLDLVSSVAEVLGSTKKDANVCIDAVVGAIIAQLIREGEVKISGLGTLNVKGRAARKGVNPKTGAPIKVAACKIVGFRPTSALKEAVNK